MNSPSTYRFDKKLTQTVDDLMDMSGAVSRTEVIRHAVALYQIVMVAKKGGNRLILESGKGSSAKQREIILP